MQLRHVITTALTAAVLAAAFGDLAAAAPAKPANRDKAGCFYARNVDGFAAVDDQTVNIRVGVKDVYQLTLFSPSQDLAFTQGIALKAKGGDWICSALDATVVVRSPIGPQSIPVNTIKKLTPAQVAALPAKARP
ncbi:MAG TPA: DUF6491 family protein [Caulobacteraceae bacterium]|jgi:hypothetical protein|nr:DUF6491 family protein [Caulobacteraceae bacterium]